MGFDTDDYDKALGQYLQSLGYDITDIDRAMEQFIKDGTKKEKEG